MVNPVSVIQLVPNKDRDDFWDCKISGKFGKTGMAIPEELVTPLAINLRIVTDIDKILEIKNVDSNSTITDLITYDEFNMPSNKVDKWVNNLLDLSESDLLKSYANVVKDLVYSVSEDPSDEDKVDKADEDNIPNELEDYPDNPDTITLDDVKDSLDTVIDDITMGEAFNLISKYIIQQEADEIPYQNDLIDAILDDYDLLKDNYKKKADKLISYLKVGYA